MGEQENPEPEHLFRLLVENMLEGMVIVDWDTTILFANKMAAALLGFDSAEELIGHKSLEFVHPDSQDLLLENLNAIKRGETRSNNEYRFTTNTGKDVWVETNGTKIEFEDRSADLVTFNDITEKKRVREALRYRLASIDMIATISTAFINLQPDKIDKGIHQALENIGKFTGADRSYVLLCKDGTKMDRIYEWCREGIESRKEHLKGLDVNVVAEGTHKKRFTMPRASDLSEKTGIPEEVLHGGVQSLINPIIMGDTVYGFCGLDSVSNQQEWSDDIVSMLKIVAEIFANALERNRSQEALQKREEEFRLTIDSMGDAIHVIDDKFRIILCSKALKVWNKELGLETDMVGKTVFEVYPFLPDRVRDEYQQVFNTKKPLFTEEKTYINGEEFITETRKIPFVEEGKIRRFVTIIRDITERKKAEEALRKSEEEFRLAFENAKDAIFWADPETGIIMRCNKAAETLTEKKKEEIVGHHQTEMHPPEEADYYAQVFKDHATLIGVDAVEAEVITKSQKRIPVHISASVMTIGGNPIIQGIFRDITDRKKAEDKIKTSLKEKEVLLKEIHHRVKNNMQVISSLLSLQSTYITDQSLLDMFKDTQNRIRSMALVHENLYQSEDFANIDFKEYIEVLAAHVFQSYSADSKDITLTIDAEKCFLEIGTAVPCGLIINELVSNSVKHAFPGGEGEITIKFHALNEDVNLVVSDNGVGIPEEIDIRNTESLGLQLVTILAEEQLDGAIRVNRKKGTEFCITFKRVL